MTTPEQVGMSSERLTRIRHAAVKHIGASKLAGAVLLVARHGEVVALESFGLMDRERNRPMPTDAIFRIYSMTKPITSVAVLMLYEQGYFQLSDPVAKFIPGFADLKVCVGGMVWSQLLRTTCDSARCFSMVASWTVCGFSGARRLSR